MDRLFKPGHNPVEQSAIPLKEQLKFGLQMIEEKGRQASIADLIEPGKMILKKMVLDIYDYNMDNFLDGEEGVSEWI